MLYLLVQNIKINIKIFGTALFVCHYFLRCLHELGFTRTKSGHALHVESKQLIAIFFCNTDDHFSKID